jgi:hypothetical protein
MFALGATNRSQVLRYQVLPSLIVASPRIACGWESNISARSWPKICGGFACAIAWKSGTWDGLR